MAKETQSQAAFSCWEIDVFWRS